MLLKMKDGGIKEIYSSESSFKGCDTCDHGSEYINEFFVEMTTGNVEVETNKMYNYALSSDYLIKLFLVNIDKIKQMTEQEFFQWLENKLNSDLKDEVEELKIDFSLNF